MPLKHKNQLLSGEDRSKKVILKISKRVYVKKAMTSRTSKTKNWGPLPQRETTPIGALVHRSEKP